MVIEMRFSHGHWPLSAVRISSWESGWVFGCGLKLRGMVNRLWITVLVNYSFIDMPLEPCASALHKPGSKYIFQKFSTNKHRLATKVGDRERGGERERESHTCSIRSFGAMVVSSALDGA